MPSKKQRKPDYSKAPIESQRRMGRYIPPQQESKHHPVIKPFVWMEKRIWEPMLAWGENQALIGILGLLANVSLLVGVVTYVASEKQRRETAVSQAWQTITSAQGQSGNGGRINALEFLNASPEANWRLRFPWICVSEKWFCSKWNAEPLNGVDVSNAYLKDVQLAKSRLIGANFSNAVLNFADFQEANLWGANLQEASLFGADLQEADLQGADLQGADLQGANFYRALLSGANLQRANLSRADLREVVLAWTKLQEATYTYSTRFPKDFDPKAAGMKLIQ